jgi:transcriptional regulator with XRE-family HTH domain
MPCKRLACWHGRGYGGRGSGDSGAGRVDEAQVAAAEITGRGPGAIVRGIRAARGMTLAELGKRMGYSAAQVSRFERGIAPLTDIAVLRRFAAALEIAPETLGLAPGQASGKQRQPGRPAAESVKPYADRGLVGRQQWNGIIRDASSEVWLYGMAEFGYASDDAVPSILARATARGCRVRVLLLSPRSQSSEAIDRDEGHPPGTLAARITAALARFGQMRRACGARMQIRVYDEYPTVSVVRGDDAMLVTPYLRFFIGSNSPTFEFRADQAPKLFTRYARHVENTWKLAKDWP